MTIRSKASGADTVLNFKRGGDIDFDLWTFSYSSGSGDMYSVKTPGTSYSTTTNQRAHYIQLICKSSKTLTITSRGIGYSGIVIFYDPSTGSRTSVNISGNKTYNLTSSNKYFYFINKNATDPSVVYD